MHAEWSSTTAVAETGLLAGRYRIERVIGEGGMGRVLEVTHVDLGQRLALKIMLPEFSHNPEGVARFLREARSAAQLKSDHVVRVTDVARLDDGAPYMVMEYLDGVDLKELLRIRGRLSVTRVVSYLLQACEALEEAHDLGIVHRDIKPANLFAVRMRDGTTCVKVLDFGISKAPERSADGQLTRTHAAIGSPSYMSPEQMQSSRCADARADIWSLGVTCYELLAGTLPFGGETITELCMHIALDPPTPLAEHRADVPQELCEVINRCLEKSPEDRFSTVAELSAALRAVRQRRHDRDDAVNTAGAAEKAQSTGMGWGNTLRRFPQDPQTKKRPVAVVFGLVLLLALAIPLIHHARRSFSSTAMLSSPSVSMAAAVSMPLTGMPSPATTRMESTCAFPVVASAAASTAVPTAPSARTEVRAHRRPKSASSRLPAAPVPSATYDPFSTPY